MKARGSAGGKISAARKKLALVDAVDEGGGESPPEDEKVTNSAPTGDTLIEDDDYFETSVVLAREGVWTGTDGEPRFKPFEALSESAKWMLGTPITNGHIPGSVLPSTRKIGQIVSVDARPDKRDIYGTARFYKNSLDESELTLLRMGKPIDGSIGYRTPIKRDPGVWNDQDYSAIETGPFVLEEYAILPGGKGACSSKDGCGIFQNAAPDNTPKGETMTDDVSISEKFEKLLNEASEKMNRLEAEITELKTKNEAADGALKQLNEAFEAKKVADDEAKLTSEKAMFVKQLNAASAADPEEVEKLFNAYKADPVGWLVENRKKLLAEVDPKKADGKQFNAGGQDPYEAAKARTSEIMFKRR